jgi:hypothetical protein
MRRSIRLLLASLVIAGTVGVDRIGRGGDGPPAASKGRTPRVASPAARPGGASVAAAATDPRAASLVRAAQNLEKAGKKAGAVGLYRDVLIRYPKSAEAPDAASRVAALGGKLPTSEEIRPAPPAEKARYTRAPKPKYASQAANRAALEQELGGMMDAATTRPAPAAGGYSPY